MKQRLNVQTGLTGELWCVFSENFGGSEFRIFFSQGNIVHRNMPQDWKEEMKVGEFWQDGLGEDLDVVLITYGVSHKYSLGTPFTKMV